jgi:hypothetical protein
VLVAQTPAQIPSCTRAKCLTAGPPQIVSGIPQVLKGSSSPRRTRGAQEDLAAELESLAEAERVVSLDTEAIKREVQSRAADVKELLFRQTPQARQMLRKLLDGKLELTPIESEGCCVYRFTGTGTYERLFSGEALETLERTVVAPTGFDTCCESRSAGWFTGARLNQQTDTSKPNHRRATVPRAIVVRGV